MLEYSEPFLGGGAVFFYMVSNNNMNYAAHLIDINRDLINAYNVVKSNVEDSLLFFLNIKKNTQNHLIVT